VSGSVSDSGRAGLRSARAGHGEELERGVEHEAEEVEDRARREEQRRSYRALARVGLLARAVVYLLIGALTLEIAVLGHSSSGPSSTGAFVEIAHQPGGKVILFVLALGLIAYAAWRVVQAAAGVEPRSGASGPVPDGRDRAVRRLGLRRKSWSRLGWLASGVVYVSLFAEALDIVLGTSSTGGPTERPDPFVADLLREPAGAGLVGLIGTAIAAGGVALLVWGAVHSYDEVLASDHMSTRSRRAARLCGIAGDAARGVAVVLVAGFLLDSAVSGDPHRARAVDGALEALKGVPGGPALLGLLGTGMLAFSLYSVFEARYRRL
jgi:hypothetical protein